MPLSPLPPSSFTDVVFLPPFPANGSPGAPALEDPEPNAAAITAVHEDGSCTVSVSGPAPAQVVLPPQRIASASPFAQLRLSADDNDSRLVARAFVGGDWHSDLRFCDSDFITGSQLHAAASARLIGGPDAAAALLRTTGVAYEATNVALLDLLDAYERCYAVLAEAERAFLASALDFVRWRRAGIESHVAWLSGFVDDVRRRVDGDWAFCADSLKAIVEEDLSASNGRNVMALYVGGALTLEDLKRYFALWPEAAARCHWDGGAEGGYWHLAPRIVREAWCGAYQTRGSALIAAPHSPHAVAAFEFFERHGILDRRGGGGGKVRWELTTERRDRDLLCALLRQLNVGAVAVPSSEPVDPIALVHDTLVGCEAVAYHHPLDAARSRFDQLAALACASYGPGGDLCGGEWRADRLPLIVVRRVHHWTLPALSGLVFSTLCDAFASRCKWVFEGDFDCDTPSCRAVRDGLGERFVRLRSGTLLEPPHSARTARGELLQELLQGSEARAVFLKHMRPPLANAVRLIGAEEAIPSGALDVESLDQVRHERRPLATPLAVDSRSLRRFQDLYAACAATADALYVRATDRAEVERLAAMMMMKAM